MNILNPTPKHHTFKKAGFAIPYELIAQLGSEPVKKRTKVDAYNLSCKQLQIKANDLYTCEVDLETYEKRSKDIKLRVVRKSFSCGKTIDPKKHSHLKKLMKDFQPPELVQLLFEREVRNHDNNVHENIVPVIKTKETTVGNIKQFHIWLAYGGSDLKGLHYDNHITIHEWIYFLLQSFKGVEHMHKEDFIHRDLKPDNIVVDEEGRARLIDLGDAHKLDNTASLREKHGTPYYRAPEVWCGEEQGKATDVYAAGMCIIKALELCGLMQPQPDARRSQFCPVQWTLTKAGEKVQGVIDIIPVLQKMTEDCPAYRPTISEAIEMLSDAWGPILIDDEEE